MSFHGYTVENLKFGETDYEIEQLDVGWAYAVPSLFPGLRRSNNREHACEQAIEDINSGGQANCWRHSEANHGSTEYIFMLRQEIADLKANAQS
jgi:hypothetical protein